jgi:type I restriction enzyme S subunit
MSTWTRQKLGEVANIIPDSIGRDFKHEIIEYIDISNVGAGNLFETQEIKIQNAPSRARRLVKLGDTILSTVRPNRRSFFYFKNPKENTVVSTGFAVLRALGNNDPRYLYYSVTNQSFTRYLTKNAKGSAYPAVDASIIYDGVVFIPEKIEDQSRIASVLSAYDDLIENNEKRIKALEEMAQLLYTEWFVKFKFPGHKKVKMFDSGTEYGMIPEGWGVMNVENLIKRIPVGKKYENKSVSETGKVPVLDQGKSGFIGFHDDEPGIKASVENPVIVFANHTCYQNIIVYPFSALQNVLPFIPKDDRDIFWLHWATKDLIKFNDYKGHWPEFMAKKFIVPCIDLTKKVGAIVGQYVMMKYKIETENKTLSQARDLLIPQLVTGRREVR